MTFEEQLKNTGYLVYKNKGISMMPLLREDKDLMVIETCEFSKLKKYDAVLFIRPCVRGRGHYVLHRILKVNSNGTYWIVGDNCVSGETVTAENIIGILTGVIRDGKRINVTDKKYLLYVHLWCDFFHIRCLLLRSRWFAGRVYHYLRRRLKLES